jgi:hypothetical protein
MLSLFISTHFTSLTHSLTHPHIFTVSCLDCLKHSQTLSYRAIPQPGRAKQSYRHPSKALTHSSTPALLRRRTCSAVTSPRVISHPLFLDIPSPIQIKHPP